MEVEGGGGGVSSSWPWVVQPPQKTTTEGFAFEAWCGGCYMAVMKWKINSLQQPFNGGLKLLSLETHPLSFWVHYIHLQW